MSPSVRNWSKFSLAILMLILLVTFFASGWTPPGPVGEVLRHNQERDIDASPLFYFEVEHITDLQKKLAARKDSAGVDTADRVDAVDAIDR